MTENIRLDIGCGLVRQEGFIGIDKAKTPAVDIVCDLDKEILPFEIESVDFIRAFNILEHLNNVESAMQEFHRVLKKGGILEIKVPYFRHPITVNPLHKSQWQWHSIDYWTNKDTTMALDGHSKFKLLERRFEKENGKCFIPLWLGFYQHIWSVFFPARYVYYKLEKAVRI